MKLQTPVADEKCRVGISYDDKIMMLGSCFSDNIGKRLSELGFDVCVNPFGTLYNPASIASAVSRLVNGEHFTEKDCVEIGAGCERVCSFSHHTSFSGTDAKEFLTKANDALVKASLFFRECNKVIITLGTSWCFRHLERDFIVSNCLKRPAAEFRRERLRVQETADTLQRIIDLCADRAAEDPEFVSKEFIFTVSPIRHFKDGAHGNQISKSTLLLGIEEVVANAENSADYFPAYEIVMDELRDYRFYAEDMCHPSAQAVDYIRERFLSWALPSSEQGLLEDNIRAFKRSQHLTR